jgi:hypothetical protein
MQQRGRAWVLIAAMVVAAAGGAVLVGTSCAIIPVGVDSCAVEDPLASINVAGAYRYSGQGSNLETGNAFSLSGTITFVQEGNRVRVSDTTYDFAGLRRVQSDFAELQGNRLVLAMTPINGDTDYVADVTFIFSEDGATFCVAYEDTNMDTGDLGSFRGVRVTE